MEARPGEIDPGREPDDLPAHPDGVGVARRGGGDGAGPAGPAPDARGGRRNRTGEPRGAHRSGARARTGPVVLRSPVHGRVRQGMYALSRAVAPTGSAADWLVYAPGTAARFRHFA
ncbi:hypothetical protein ACIHEJ_29615 [Streptomyces sp. NPDC052301]|uniref:hypothetical protein n=1 Tax=Streptomyces sp. NPDC052301 TaxID=3365687 RepID=UPI0037D55914